MFKVYLANHIDYMSCSAKLNKSSKNSITQRFIDTMKYWSKIHTRPTFQNIYQTKHNDKTTHCKIT